MPATRRANGAFSIRHSTRNFPNREGSKPSDGQVSYVALMDARSIAATAELNGGASTAATELDWIPEDICDELYDFDDSSYKARVYYGVGKADPSAELVLGPNITDWPEQIALPENLLLTTAAAIYDPVTTTDELIPSGETSSYRSNPVRLSDFALSRKDPQYVPRAKVVKELEIARRKGDFMQSQVLVHWSWQFAPAMVPPVNRRHLASVFWAAVQISQKTMPPSGIVPM